MDPVSMIRGFIDKKEIAGAGLVVRRGGREVLHALEGFADSENGVPVTDGTVFRLASMSKPVTAVAVMQLEERGLLRLDDPVEAYLPIFAHRKVPDASLTQEEKAALAGAENSGTAKAAAEKLLRATLRDAARPFTVRDLLTHSSGLGMGPVSAAVPEGRGEADGDLARRVRAYARLPLDFDPGTATGYSPLLGFDVLGRIVEAVSGEDLDRYVRRHITSPLGAGDMGFRMTPEQRSRLAVLYERTEDGRLSRRGENDPLWRSADPAGGFFSGAAGMVGSLPAYARFAEMLLGRGEAGGARILQSGTVDRMASERAAHGLELFPGARWGLGMLVFEDPQRAGRALGRGAYGWSGAYGTHFYIDPKNDLCACLMVQRSNIGGASSPVSAALERAIYDTFIA